MGSAKYFTSIDLYSEYWQYCIADEDILKTPYLTRYSLYKRVIIPMGLTNAPAIFIQTINNLFSNMLDFGMAVILDDILVYSHMIKEHFTLLEKILVCLCPYIFYCKLKKRSFLQDSITFLSFDIMYKGMHISDLKVQSLNKWPIPTTVKIQLFLGFV